MKARLRPPAWRSATLAIKPKTPMRSRRPTQSEVAKSLRDLKALWGSPPDPRRDNAPRERSADRKTKPSDTADDTPPDQDKQRGGLRHV